MINKLLLGSVSLTQTLLLRFGITNSTSLFLFQYYKNNAKHPFATTMAEEIFQSGMLPSDTDFRIFRDYGHVPGRIKLMQQFNNLI